MKNISTPFVLIIFIFYGCKQERTNNKSYIVMKDGNGNIQSEINYINDSIMDGLAKYYYKNGKLQDEVYYVKGLKSGIQKHYTQDGKLESVIEFKNGLQDGYTYWYYKNGKVESKSFWLNGKSFGDAYNYYYTGILESYRSFDFQEHCRYLIKYDNKGKKIREEGTVLGQFVLDYGDFKSIPLNKSIPVNISFANPPNTYSKILLSEIVENKMIIDSKEPASIKNGIAIYMLTFNKKGLHKIVTVGQIIDLKGNLLKQDTILTNITVN